MNQLWLIEFDNAHWCCGQAHCVVWATSAFEAEGLAEAHMQEYQYDLFSDQYYDEPDMDDGLYYTIISVEPLEGSESEQFYRDPKQREAFYPCVNPQDAPE